MNAVIFVWNSEEEAFEHRGGNRVVQFDPLDCAQLFLMGKECTGDDCPDPCANCSCAAPEDCVFEGCADCVEVVMDAHSAGGNTALASVNTLRDLLLTGRDLGGHDAQRSQDIDLATADWVMRRPGHPDVAYRYARPLGTA